MEGEERGKEGGRGGEREMEGGEGRISQDEKYITTSKHFTIPTLIDMHIHCDYIHSSAINFSCRGERVLQCPQFREVSK